MMIIDNKDLFHFLKDDLLSYGDIPPLTGIKRKYEIDNEKLIKRAVTDLKRQGLLTNDFKLLNDYEQ